MAQLIERAVERGDTPECLTKWSGNMGDLKLVFDAFAPFAPWATTPASEISDDQLREQEEATTDFSAEVRAAVRESAREMLVRSVADARGSLLAALRGQQISGDTRAHVISAYLALGGNLEKVC